MVGKAGIRLGQHLPVYGDIVRHVHAGEWPVVRERRKLLRLIPAQAASQDAAAAAQTNGHEIIIAGGRKPGAGEAHQHAPIIDPLAQALAGIGRHVADVGEDDHRHMLVNELFDGIRRRSALGDADVGKWAERPLQIKIGREQGLRGVRRRTGRNADGSAVPSLVEQLHGTGGVFRRDFQAGNVVANFNGQVELRFRLQLTGPEAERRLAERKSLEIERAHETSVVGRWFGTQNLHAQHAGGVVGGGERVRTRKSAGNDRQRMLVDCARKRAGEVAGPSGVHPVRKPEYLGIRSGGQKTRQSG